MTKLKTLILLMIVSFYPVGVLAYGPKPVSDVEIFLIVLALALIPILITSFLAVRTMRRSRQPKVGLTWSPVVYRVMWAIVFAVIGRNIDDVLLYFWLVMAVILAVMAMVEIYNIFKSKQTK